MNKMLLALLAILLNASFINISYSSIDRHWEAEKYSDNAHLQALWAEQFFFDHYKFKGNEKVLDIGSGDGKITAKIAKLSPRGYVIGLDNSNSMITKSQITFKNITNLSFVEDSADNGEFYKKHLNEFDIVTSFTALHWVKNQDDVLRGIYSSLKPNTLVYIRLCSKGGDPIQEIMDSMIRDPKWAILFKDFKDPITRYSIAEYSNLMERNGFKIISITDKENKDNLDNIRKLKQQIKSWAPHYHFLVNIDQKQADNFIDELIDNYLHTYTQNTDGSITLYDHYLEIIAKKS